MADIVDLDEIEAITEAFSEYAALADALEQLARALKTVERVGYEVGFNWYEQRWTPGEGPSDFATRLERWAQTVREHERSIRSPDS